MTDINVPEQITVNGLTIHAKKPVIYQIVHRPDPDGPKGFKKVGATKVPTMGVGDNPVMKYDKSQRVWDTGFFERSPCYRGMPKEEVAGKVAFLNKYIVEPFDEIYGKQPNGRSKLHQSNSEFWDDWGQEKGYMLHDTQMFTPQQNPEEMLRLYTAVHGRYASPKGTKEDKKAYKCPYWIINTGKEQDIVKESILAKDSATDTFKALLKVDKQRLIAVLQYAKLTVLDSYDDSDLLVIFKQWLDVDSQNVNTFKKFASLVETQTGLETIWLFKALEKLSRTGKLQMRNMTHYFEDVALHQDFRTAASMIAQNPSNKYVEIKRLIMEQAGLKIASQKPTMDNTLSQIKTYMLDNGYTIPRGAKSKQELLDVLG